MKIVIDVTDLEDWGVSVEQMIQDEIKDQIKKMVRAEVRKGSAEMNKSIKTVVTAALTQIGKARVAEIIKGVLAEDKKGAA